MDVQGVIIALVEVEAGKGRVVLDNIVTAGVGQVEGTILSTQLGEGCGQ